MNIRTLLKTTLCLSMLFASASTFAQVKIGTNPTTIDGNSNLEVEATNNKKVIVHKNDGTVVIENTPPGAVTDGILSVDAVGNVRKISAASIVPQAYIFEAQGSKLEVAQGGYKPLPFQTNVTMNPSSATADRNNANTWKAPVAGIYRIDIKVDVIANNNKSGVGISTVYLNKNGVDGVFGQVSLTTYGPLANQGGATLFFSKVMKLAAGDIIGANMATCSGCGPDTYWGTANLTIQRLE
jgi:hypothetical protein